MNRHLTVQTHDLATLAQSVQDRFQRVGWSLAAMESCTGGLLASAITDIEGSGHLLGALVCYDTKLKIACGVPEEIINRHGVVSAATAEEMAKAAAIYFRADFGISTTGVAGRESEDGVEPGTVYIGAFGRSRGVQSRLLKAD